MKDYSKMLWDSTEPFPGEIAQVFYLLAAHPEEMFNRAFKSDIEVEKGFWKQYFGADFQNETLPEYLNEINNLDWNTRRIFSIIAFALLDKTILERLIESDIKLLKGSVRTDGLDPSIVHPMIAKAFKDDTFRYTSKTAVEFNFAKVLSDPLFGKCLMNLLNSRLRYLLNESREVSFNELLKTCFELKFHKALGLTETIFKLWLNGTAGMLCDSNEAVAESESIVVLFSSTAANPEDMFIMAQHYHHDYGNDFWVHYFGADFQNPIPPDYLFELRDIDRDARIIFSIIAFALLDYDILERLIESDISQLKGKVRASDFNRLIKRVRLFGISDSFKSEGEYIAFNFEKVLNIPLFWKCLMKLLNSRLRYLLDESYEVSFDKLMEVCNELNFYTALGLSRNAFRQLLKGTNASVTGYYISSTSISNFICIENAFLDFSNSMPEPSKEVYLLGDNGDGKTLILEALLMTYTKERIKDSAEDMGNAYKLYKTAKVDGALLKGEDEKKTNYGNGYYFDLPRIFAYGTHRGRIYGEPREKDKPGFLTLFDTNKILTDPSRWIIDYIKEGYGTDVPLSHEEYLLNFNEARERREELQQLLDDILNKKIRIKIEKDNSVKYVEHEAELDFDQLSEGYRTTLIFICDLLFQLIDSQPSNRKGKLERCRKAKAVVLIDEIDAHLHPRWQRKIVGKMRKLFPNVQFIMTSHSPFIIQGASPDAVIFRLFRENGKTCVSEPIKRSELDYMMINTLATSPIFDMGSARLSNDNIYYTSNSYLMERIEKTILEKIRNDKSRNYLSEKEIDEMISETWEQIDSENQ